MPSPLWTNPKGPMIAAAIAAAIHEAWHHPPANRARAMHDALRKALGPELYERAQHAAHDVLLLQEEAPEGMEIPPSWAWFEICPRCMSMKRTRHTAPQNARLKLQILRDRRWLEAQVEAGATAASLARKLECTPALIDYWLAKHGLRTERQLRKEEIEATVRRMHLEKEGPGTIARALGGGMTAERVRDVLQRLGLATSKAGQVYHDREWWRVRLEDRGKTKLDCAREAGIKPHAANYWLKQFSLQHLVKDNKRRKRYPELHSPTQLSALLLKHGHSYEAVARELGCAPTLVSYYARKLLGVRKKQHNHLPHSERSWWVERLDRGATTYELAEEAGIAEKTARERCRNYGLLGQALANNMRRERERRRGAA